MLGKINRLQKDKEFSKVFKAGKPIFEGNLSLRCAKKDGTINRFGFVISNKIDKRASRRNGLKRRLRAIVRELIPEMKSGYDVIVSVKQNYPSPYDFGKIRADLINGFKKLGLIS